MHGKRGTVAVAALALVAVAGCGDDGKPSASPSAGGPPVALPGMVNDHGTKDVTGKKETDLELDDFYFGPTYLRVTPSTTYTLELENEGDVVHTLTIDGFPVDVTVQPGTKAEATIAFPATGAVRFYCRFHAGQGMQGAFYFNPGDVVTNTGGSGSNGSTTGGGASATATPTGNASMSADSGDGAYGQ